MSDDGEIWEGYHQERREKKANNLEYSTNLIEEWALQHKVTVMHFNGGVHLRIGTRWYFWPSTGKYLDRKTGKYKRGVRELIKDMERI